ncbi:MAG TPA: response regulator transcription factor [Candidatus Limnocylindrales bacterium]|nr:response regulator transcription factor [Candidatus Limnocylindrales bacterium]
MVALPPSESSDIASHRSRPAGPERAAWLVLADDGPARELADLVPDTAIRITADPRRFRDALLAERPRVVVVAQPPATVDDLDLVAGERKRRLRLRAVHLAPPDAGVDRLAALARGFDDALTTATSGAELAGRLRWLEARARERPSPGTPLPIGDDLELDLAAHELRRGDLAIHLRPKEFGLLALLAAHPGRAYTRRELLERVWGTGSGSGARTVDVHVRWLRSKIEPAPDHPVHLITVRGVGYRLDPPTR